MTLTRRKNWVANLGLVLGSLICTLAAVEMGLRLFTKLTEIPNETPRYMFRASDTLGYEMARNFNGIMYAPGRYRIKVQTNSLGLREDREFGKKGEKDFRILVLGDSITFGKGVEAEEAFPRVLERFLKKHFDDSYCWEVINAGVSGYGTRQEFAYLKESGLKLMPDVVILGFFPGNDLADNMGWFDKTVRDGHRIHKISLHQLDNPSEKLFVRIKIFLRQHVMLYSLVIDRLKSIPSLRGLLVNLGLLHGLRQGPKTVGEPVDANLAARLGHLPKTFEKEFLESWEKTKEIMLQLHSLLTSNHMRLLVVILPSKFQVHKEHWLKVRRQYPFLTEDYQDINRINGLTVDFCNAHHIACIDLLPVFETKAFDGEGLYINNDGHFNKRGHIVAAESIFKKLMEGDFVSHTTCS